MSLDITKNNNRVETKASFLNEDKIALIKRTICKKSTDEELELFIHACQKTGLDPFMRQIFAVKRWDSSEKREMMTIQTGIDGYRLIADRTGRYSPGKDTEFGYEENGNLKWAKSYVKKMTPDGKWHEISAIAFWKEYAQITKEGKPTIFWQNKGHIMLAKCAEALVLRKAFPAELSGIYTQEEMQQNLIDPSSIDKKDDIIGPKKAEEIMELIGDDEEFYNHLLERLKRAFGGDSFADLPLAQYENIKKVIFDYKNKEKVS